MEPRGNAQVVWAYVPLSEMFGYATDLRSQTQGRATYTMQFERYEEVPSSLADEITEHRAGTPVGAEPERWPRAGLRAEAGRSSYIFAVAPRSGRSGPDRDPARSRFLSPPEQ